MRDLIDLKAFWQLNEGAALALCTLVRKHESGYRAEGAKKIIARDGSAYGLLSGGCLEGDIERTALKRWDDMPFIESFSTMDETDRLLGYQTGCAGIINILFERLPATGADMDLYLPFGPEPRAEGVAISLAADTLAERTFGSRTDSADAYFDPWVRPVKLFIIGCGTDASAFAELAGPMGWDVRFLDYRSHFQLPEQCGYTAEIMRIDEIADAIPDGERTAIVLMTHNYEADMTILRGLAGRPFGYVGCLGPRVRYDGIKRDLQRLQGVSVPEAWETIVHAPAGLFTSGRAPEEIALSIIAQIQSLLRVPDRD